VAAPPEKTELREFRAEERHMGVSFKIVLYAPEEEAATAAFTAAFARIAALDKAMSDYDSASELSRLSAASPTERPVPLSDDLFHVLYAAQSFSERSDGAFDVTVGPLTKLWRRARRQQEMPAEADLKAALAAVGYRSVRLDAEKKTAMLLAENMRLDLGGIAAGYAVDEALQEIQARGIQRALVNSSGDLVFGDPPPGKRGWEIGVAPNVDGGPPTIYLELANAAISTSGDAFQHVVLGGKRYSHILDPKTGLGLTDQSGVTIVAADGITADALASAVSVLGPEKGLVLVESYKDVHAFIVRAPHGKVETHRSRGFDSLPRAPREE
jgi:thiamine biosynthesis lipoprotein